MLQKISFTISCFVTVALVAPVEGQLFRRQAAPQQYAQPVQQFQPQGQQFQPAQQYQPAQQFQPQAQGVQQWQGQPQPTIQPGIVNQTYSTHNGPQQSTAIQTTNVRIPWSQKLIEAVTTKHDFGAVPAESKQEHIFEFTNTTPDTLELVGVKASCGCTKPTILTRTVAPGEKAQVLAQFQTKTFRGEKKATVTVSLNRNGQYSEYGEVQFSVQGKIRKDVVLIPGEVDFATLSKSGSQSAQQVLKMKYAGSPLWQILDVKSSNDHLKVDVREIAREQTGRVVYELVVKIDGEMPVGSFEDELTIITNDRKTSKMPISVCGRIKPALEAAPVNLGIVKQGSKVEKRFVVRGDKPFIIREIRIGSTKVKFRLNEGEKSLHVIPYSVDTSTPANIREKLTVITSDADNPQKIVDFNIRIVPEAVADSN